MWTVSGSRQRTPSTLNKHPTTCTALQEVGKRDALLEERLHAQDVEYRRQCEELRMKVQQLLKDRDQQVRVYVD